MKNSLFKHNAKDGLLVLVSLFHIGLLTVPAFYFNAMPFWSLILLGFAQAFFYGMNFQCTGHNFLHNPFFSSKLLNKLFSIINSLALGFPQTLYKYHHYNHHAHNNDIPESYGNSADRSSIFRFSKKQGQPEHILAYSLLGPFRSETHLLWRDAVERKQQRLALLEASVLVAFICGLFWINWHYGMFYLATWYAGQCFAFAENYLEHYRATGSERLNNSVSAYAKWYNFIWFNNGYHQEHHYRPNTHWTQIPEIRKMMLDESERRVVSCHWFNFGRG